ncbi:MAG: hypothetical protein EZS28_028292 [Streblomastix strix]|uniref:Uncharacterized protein n=1 Tax=Streblomastix strix TaxID=222440 RepID=A0A5J4V1E3_9EUKA|nr:MAG: hypothetical protein EZS28_028292 [Streblomastix strix]
MSKIPKTTKLNPKEVFEALSVSMADVNEDQQTHIAAFLAKSARSLKHALKDHEKGKSIESLLISTLSLTSEQASMSSTPFHQILQDEGKISNLLESNIPNGKKKKDYKKESDESSSESDSCSSSDGKGSSNSESDDYISIAEQQVPIAGRIRKNQGKLILIPFDLTGATGVTQVGNLITISSSSTQSISFNKIFKKKFGESNAGSSGIDAAENGSSVYGSKSYAINDIIGIEVNMIKSKMLVAVRFGMSWQRERLDNFMFIMNRRLW